VGVLLNRFWWGSVFLIALPVMGLLLVLGPTLLPEFRDPEAGRLDLVSAAMSLTAVLTAIYGLKRIAPGWPGLGAGGLDADRPRDRGRIPGVIGRQVRTTWAGSSRGGR